MKYLPNIGKKLPNNAKISKFESQNHLNRVTLETFKIPVTNLVETACLG
jgi:hypothetical protein